MTSSVQDIYLSTKTNTALSRFQREKICAYFLLMGFISKSLAKSTWKLKLSLRSGLIVLDIEEKKFQLYFFYEVQISKFWISLLLRVFKIAMLALIPFLAFVQKENTTTGFSFLYGMAWPPSACNVMSGIHSYPFSLVFEPNRIEGEVFYLSRGIKFPPLIQLSHFQV